MSDAYARGIARLRRLARLLDSAFRIPGTRVRFGLDPVLGLAPWGDVVTTVFALTIVAHALRYRVPPVIVARMAGNVVIDALVSLVPFVGDVADVFLRANQRNLALLERHAGGQVRPRARDYVVVVGAIVLALSPVLVAAWALYKLLHYLARF